jgi:hypothetical protein
VPKWAKDLPEYDAIVAGSEQMTAFVHNEDIDANDTVWRGLNAPMTSQGRLSPLERSIWQLNQWWVGKIAQG